MVLMGEAVSFFFFEYMHTATGSSGASRPRIIFAFRLVRLIVRNKVLLFPSLPTSLSPREFTETPRLRPVGPSRLHASPNHHRLFN